MRLLTHALLLTAIGARTSARTVIEPDPFRLDGLQTGKKITALSTHGEVLIATYRHADSKSLVAAVTGGEVRTVPRADVKAVRFREYDGDKTATVAGGAVVLAGIILLQVVEALEVFATGALQSRPPRDVGARRQSARGSSAPSEKNQSSLISGSGLHERRAAR